MSSKRSATLELFQQGKRQSEIVRLHNAPQKTVSVQSAVSKNLAMVIDFQELGENAIYTPEGISRSSKKQSREIRGFP
ncbi:hypothetical protein TNCV_3703461 [Trichonephila clavipes]|nr:hypothetical protein TNCV_3703461 [Trichonephila clavipes]